MKKLITTLLCVCLGASLCVSLTGCLGGGGDKAPKLPTTPVDLTADLGTDAEILAAEQANPINYDYFEFIYLPGTDSYGVRKRYVNYNQSGWQSIPQNANENEDSGYFIVPGEYNGKKVTHVLKNGFTASGRQSYLDEKLLLMPGIEVIEEGAFESAYVKYAQFPSTLRRMEYDSCSFMEIETLKLGKGVQEVYVDMPGTEEAYENFKLTLPDSVRSVYLSIGSGSYYKNSITKWNGGEYVGNANNPYLALVRYQGIDESSRHKKVTICPHTKVIGEKVFSQVAPEKDGKTLNITIPEGVVGIGHEAFMSANEGVTITVPNTVEFIGNNAFKNAGQEFALTVSDKFSYFGDFCLEGNTVTNYKVEKHGKYISSVSNPYMIYASSEVFNNTSLNPETDGFGYPIHENTKFIGSYAFKDTDLVWNGGVNETTGLTPLEWVTLKVPAGVERIAQYAFADCSWIQALSVPFVGASKLDAGEMSWFFKSDDFGGSNSYDLDEMDYLIFQEGVEHVGRTSVTADDASVLKPATSFATIVMPESLKTVEGDMFINYRPYTTTSELTAVIWQSKDFQVVSHKQTVAKLFDTGNKAPSFKVYFTGTAEEWEELYDEGLIDADFKVDSGNVLFYSATAPTDTEYTYWTWDNLYNRPDVWNN